MCWKLWLATCISQSYVAMASIKVLNVHVYVHVPMHMFMLAFHLVSSLWCTGMYMLTVVGFI